MRRSTRKRRNEASERLSQIGQSVQELSDRPQKILDKIEEYLELSNTLSSRHKSADLEQKRNTLTLATSNCLVDGKCVKFEPTSPFYGIAEDGGLYECEASKRKPRTAREIYDEIIRSMFE